MPRRPRLPASRWVKPLLTFTANYLAMDNGRPAFKPVKLSDFKGQKNVVLAFFPAAFSPGCTGEMAKYQETSGQFSSNNTVILGMSVDGTWANAAFADKLGVKFNILSDASREISRSYGIFDERGLVARRTTFVIDSKGSCRRYSRLKRLSTRRIPSKRAPCSKNSSRRTDTKSLHSSCPSFLRVDRG